MKIGPYEVLGELGRGGMGVVYRARRADLGRDFALKVIRAGPDADPELVARFQREARAAAALAGHPGIVGVHDLGEDAGRIWFAMDLVDGPSLARLILDGDVPVARAVELVEQAARAVHHAHTHGILHRDIKPANILISPEGRARVTDFGLAAVRSAEDGPERLTHSGVILGTPAYMPPEQAEAAPLDARADVYALGATLYEALVGRPPFDGKTLQELLTHVLIDDPIPPSHRVPDLPVALDAIVGACLAKDRTRRYASAAALADDLARFRAGEPIAARPPGPWERLRRSARRRPAWIAGTLGITAALVVAGVIVVPRWRGETLAREAAEARGRTDRARRDAAQPFLDAARVALVRADRLLGQPDATPAGVHVLVVEARGHLQGALDACPDLPEALRERARSYVFTAQMEEALRWYDRTLAVAPAYPTARLERALLRLDTYATARLAVAGELDAEGPELAAERAAIEADLAAVAAAGGRPEEVAYANALRLVATGAWAEAAARLQTAAAAAVADADAWGWAGLAALLAGDMPAACAALDTAVRYRPGDHRFRLRRAVARQRTGDLAGAIADMDDALGRFPDMPEALANRGSFRRQLGDRLAAAGRQAEADAAWDAALKDLDHAVALAPRDRLIRVNLAMHHRARGRLADALAEFDVAVAAAPRDGRVRVMRGAARAAAGDGAGAREDYDAALDADPRDADALHNRANLRQRAGDLAGARADYDASLGARPGHANTLSDRGLCRAAAGDDDGALADYAAVLALVPDHVEALANRGTVRWRRADLDGALADFDAALARDPRRPETLANRAMVHAARGDFATAEADMTRALEVARPDWPGRAKAEGLLTKLRAAARGGR